MTVVDDLQPEAVPRIGPPIVFLAVAGLSVAASAALLVSEEVRADVARYVLGAMLPSLCGGVFRRADLARRSEPGYVARPLVEKAMPFLLLIAIVVTALHTWAIATDIAA